MAVKKSTRLLLWIAAVGALIAVAVGVGIVLLIWDRPTNLAGEPAWLELRLRGPLEDGPMPDAFTWDPEEVTLTTHEVAAALHRAAGDEDVTGLLLELDNPSLSMAAAQELRAGIAAVRAAGKPCIAWSKTYENLSWYVASACGDVRMHPDGVPLVLGLAVNTQYFSGALDKLGVQPDFERVGAYKSAIETFEEQAPSPASIEMYTTLLDSLYNTFVADLAASRGVGPEAIQALIDDPPVTASDALARGLVDRLSYQDELEDELGEDTPRVGMRKYIQRLRRGWGDADWTVAVLHLQGQVIDGDSSGGGFGGSAIGDRTVVEALEDLAEDEDIDAVVLRIDSPGGSALASDVIWRAVRELDEQKPVVASMGSTAASGGYYIAMAARQIVAQPGTVTGSIGVFAGKFALGGLYDKVGITTWTLRRGELAGLLSSPQPFSELERAKLRTRIEDFYRVFITKVAQSRGLEVEAVDAVAQGRVWTGAQAAEVGLVDQLGGLEEAVALAAGLAGAPEDAAVGRRVLPRTSTLMELLLDAQNPTEAARLEALTLLLGPELAQAAAQAASLRAAAERGVVLAWEPVTLQVR